MATLSDEIDAEFVWGFFLTPTLEDVTARFKDREKLNTFQDQWRGAGITVNELEKYFTGVFEQYILNRGEIPVGIARLAENAAERFAKTDYGHVAWLDDPNVAIQYSRFISLIEHPVFVADKRSLGILEKLADIQHNEPWRFNMYTFYGTPDGLIKGGEAIGSNKEGIGYHIRPGFELPQVEGFLRYIESDRLWTGKSNEMKRMFFTSVVEALAKLAKKYPVETLEPRLKFIEQAKKHGQYLAEHKSELWDSFTTPQEQEGLRGLIKTNSQIAYLANEFIGRQLDRTGYFV